MKRNYTPILSRLVFILLLLSLTSVGISWSQDSTETPEAALAAGAALSLPEMGELYVPLTFPIDIDSAIYTNPFDPADVELIGVFQSPGGRQLVIPGFWMQPYEDVCAADCAVEDLQPAGEPTWQVRFTPDEVGEWTYSLQVRDDGAALDTLEGRVSVAISGQRGFIRLGQNRRYFRYDNGESYFPIGHNLKWSWAEGGGLRAYEQWLDGLSAAGGNYARLYIDEPFFIGFEWAEPAGDYSAAQLAAARLDMILQMAEERGIALQLVLLWNQAVRTYNGPPVLIPENMPRPDTSVDWDDNPYNSVNGGPLSGPGVWLYSEPGQELFRRRLRYIAARYGYSPQIFAWEMIDEIDRVAIYDADTANTWLDSSVSYLRQIDQQRHLITAGSREFEPIPLGNALLDFTEVQFYQRRPIENAVDQVTGTLNVIRGGSQLADRPTLMTAFSLNPWFEPTADDLNGVHFQTTLWAAALSGSAGGAASDWWDTYVIPRDLQRYYMPLAAFVSGVDWAQLNLQPAEASLISSDSSHYEPVRIDGFLRQLRVLGPARVVAHVITADGVFPDVGDMPSYLYGRVYSEEFGQAQIYQIAAPVDTYLEVRVRSVSNQAGARLRIEIDGQTAAEMEMDASSNDLAIRLPLAVGEHTVMLDNVGDDWLELDYIEVGQLFRPARVLTLRDSAAGVALSWIHHRDYTWENVAAGAQRTPLSLSYNLDGMPPGRYAVQIWDPLSGAVLGDELVQVGDNGLLSVNLLPMDSQLALRIFRQPDLPTATPTSAATAIPATEAATEILFTDAPTASEMLAPVATETATMMPTATETSVPPTVEIPAAPADNPPSVATVSPPDPPAPTEAQ